MTQGHWVMADESSKIWVEIQKQEFHMKKVFLCFGIFKQSLAMKNLKDFLKETKSISHSYDVIMTSLARYYYVILPQ